MSDSVNKSSDRSAPDPTSLSSKETSPPPNDKTGESAGPGAVPAAAGEVAAPKKRLSRKELRLKYKAARKEAKGYYSQLIHLQADFENLKKRLIREREDYIRQAKEALVKDMLPSVDNLDYALRHAKDRHEDSPLLNGVEMTHRGLLSTLKKFGVEPVEAIGKPFDPNFHEAIAKVEREDGANQVVEEHQRGYVLDGRLLRPALVTIAVPTGPKTS